MKVFIPTTMLHIQTSLLFKKMGYTLVNLPEEADIIVFTGGEDINPELYCQKKCEYTYFSPSRDEFEVSLYNEFPNKLFVGICRGAQLLSALKGGDIVQHINSVHKGYHPVMYKNEKVMVNSLHHQAIIVNNRMKVLMAEDAPLQGIVFHYDAVNEEENLFYCVDMFKQENVFGVQFHPELMDIKERAVGIFQNELNTFIEERLCAD